MPQSKQNSRDAEGQIRISFLLNVGREPELAYLMDIEGHGDRPRELLRLARMGRRAELEMQRLADTVRLNGMRGLVQSAAAPVAPAPEAVNEGGKQPSAPSPQPHDTSAPSSAPAAPTQGNKDDNDQNDPPSVNADGFLA